MRGLTPVIIMSMDGGVRSSRSVVQGSEFRARFVSVTIQGLTENDNHILALHKVVKCYDRQNLR